MTDSTIVARTRYAIDAKLSRFVVQAFATGFLSMFAHSPKIAIRGLSGDIQFDPDSLADASLRVVVDPVAMSVIDETRDKGREIERVMRDEVLEVARFPEIVFESTRVSATKLDRQRVPDRHRRTPTLRGVTRDPALSADAILMGDLLRAYGDVHRAAVRLRHQARLGRRRRDQGEGRAEVHVRSRRASPDVNERPGHSHERRLPHVPGHTGKIVELVPGDRVGASSTSPASGGASSLGLLEDDLPPRRLGTHPCRVRDEQDQRGGRDRSDADARDARRSEAALEEVRGYGSVDEPIARHPTDPNGTRGSP